MSELDRLKQRVVELDDQLEVALNTFHHLVKKKADADAEVMRIYWLAKEAKDELRRMVTAATPLPAPGGEPGSQPPHAPAQR